MGLRQSTRGANIRKAGHVLLAQAHIMRKPPFVSSVVRALCELPLPRKTVGRAVASRANRLPPASLEGQISQTIVSRRQNSNARKGRVVTKQWNQAKIKLRIGPGLWASAAAVARSY